jgi:hypothetical protein
MARGAPKKPAAVSGPGAMSRRTDGGPGSKTQPVRVPSGGDYGERQAAETQQRSAPLAVAGGTPGGGGGAPISLPSPNGVFGPTERPNVPLAQGIAPSGQIGEQGMDAQTLLELLFQKYPSPYLARMMRNDRGIPG